MEGMQGRARLPRRDREALLFGAVPVAAGDGLGTHHCAHVRNIPSRAAHCGALHLKSANCPNLCPGLLIFNSAKIQVDERIGSFAPETIPFEPFPDPGDRQNDRGFKGPCV